jgi:hypothetical protein
MAALNAGSYERRQHPCVSNAVGNGSPGELRRIVTPELAAGCRQLKCGLFAFSTNGTSRQVSGPNAPCSAF